MKRPRAEAEQGEFRELHVERARLRLGEDRGGIAALDRAAFEHLAERVDPLALDPIGQHGGAFYPNQPAARVRASTRSTIAGARPT